MLQVEEQRRSADGVRVSTYVSRLLTVEHVIHTMKEHLHENLTLEDMADIACLSPYHFCRVFHQVIGIPPGEFHATLRLDAAKRLLLTTSLSVTDVCFEMGYSGLGSFTSRFTQLVGLPPRLLRHLARNTAISSFNTPPDPTTDATPSNVQRRGLTGCISAPDDFEGCICLGLFPKPIPQGRPVACTQLFAPGPFHMSPIPDGRYFLLSAAFSLSEDPNTYLLPDERLLVSVQGPIQVSRGVVIEAVDVVLRSPLLTDPPIIMALPFLQRNAKSELCAR